MDLLARIGAALADGAAPSLASWQALYQEAFAEHCRREDRMRYRLRNYLTSYSDPMAASSTTHRFKQAFATTKFNYEDGGTTRSITASNLTDADVAVLQQYAPHLLEELPKPEGAELSKLTKDELTAHYVKVLGTEPDAKLTKAELIAAIEAAAKIA